MDFKQPTEKQLGASASEIVNETISSLEKAVYTVSAKKIKVWATVITSGAMNLGNFKEWFNTTESEPRSTRATGSDVAVFLRSLLNIAKKVTSTTWAFKVKSYGHFEAKQVVLGWRQEHRIDCGTKLFVFRFD